jgi:hypothetical protein
MKTSPYSIDDEKRRHLRVSKEIAVMVKRLEYPLTNAAAEIATIKDISGNGICFTGPTLYLPGTLLNLKIELRGWQQYLGNVASIIDAASLTKPLTALAEVIWSKELAGTRECEVGVCFKDVYADDYQAFMKYLEKIAKKDRL